MFNIATPRTTSVPAPSSSAVDRTPAAVGKATKASGLPPTLGMAVCDASGKLTFQSPALQELLGQSFGSEVETDRTAPQHLYRQDGLTRLRPEHVPLARARQGEVVTDAVICHRSEEQVPTYLRCNAAPVASADGSVNGAVVFVEDVTAGHVGQENNQRMRYHLISTLNHELRTPLTKLVGHAEVLHDMRSQLPVNAVHSLEKVCKAVDELRELADLVSCMADLDTPGRLTEALGDTADSARDGTTQVPEQLARGGLRSVPKIPVQLVANLDPDTVSEAIATLAVEPPRPRSDT
jgi:signal transduction histidine kinase